MHLIYTTDAAFERGNLPLYNEGSADFLALKEPKLASLLGARALFAIWCPVLTPIGTIFRNFRTQNNFELGFIAHFRVYSTRRVRKCTNFPRNKKFIFFCYLV